VTEAVIDLLYVSPHADDAVFSAGASIALAARAGRRVVVATVFSRVADGDQARRAEDRAAVATLGAELVELGFAESFARDAAYRRPARLFAPALPGEAPLVEAVRAALAQAARGAEVVGPLGVGQHVDHQVAHAACAALPSTIGFYEDLPYGLCPSLTARRLAALGAPSVEPRSRRSFELAAMARWWAARPLLGEMAPAPLVPFAALAVALALARVPPPAAAPLALVEERHETAAAMEAKLAAVARYGSQWPRFFPSLAGWRAALAAHARRLGSPVAIERRFRRV
jgi:LmbE family N-acetylglucosaminyl deacetylase